MNLRDLRYLVALADARHFGHAAAKSHVSQPTLSAQIRKLEDFLGAPLVERQPRRVALTALGERVVERARRVLTDCDDIVELARAARDPLAGTLRVALIPTLGPYLLPSATPALRRRLPRLQLLLYEYQTAALLERLREGEIDVGILALGVDTEGLETRALGTEAFMLALPPAHRLAKRPAVRTADLDGETLLLLEDGHCLREQALEVCGAASVHEPADFRATSLETLRQMVAAGLGVTLLPELATRGPFAAAKSVALRPFAKPAPYRTLGAAWRRSTTRAAAIAAVCDTIAAVLAARD
ncbi:MAG TPA: LysR substrate-binding domain-containing protein [Steroidobacteraceae bacterium]|nr:LysR substrate-binding domain-containing protein [Steroidobacteraceae bacterium]